MTTKAPHHRGQYHAASRRMNAAANANPATTCWRDGLPLGRHPPRARWTCGHVDDPDLYAQHPSPLATWIDGRLCAPEASTCNYQAGARAGNRKRSTNHRTWWGGGGS